MAPVAPAKAVSAAEAPAVGVRFPSTPNKVALTAVIAVVIVVFEVLVPSLMNATLEFALDAAVAAVWVPIVAEVPVTARVESPDEITRLPAVLRLAVAPATFSLIAVIAS